MSFTRFPPQIVVLPPMALFFIADSWLPSLLLVHVLMVWLRMTLCLWDQQYLLGYRFDSYLFLLDSDFSFMVCPMGPVSY